MGKLKQLLPGWVNNNRLNSLMIPGKTFTNAAMFESSGVLMDAFPAQIHRMVIRNRPMKYIVNSSATLWSASE